MFIFRKQNSTCILSLSQMYKVIFEETFSLDFSLIMYKRMDTLISSLLISAGTLQHSSVSAVFISRYRKGMMRILG